MKSNSTTPASSGQQVRLLCVGVPKSGTTSIKGLFEKMFPVSKKIAHEPERGNHVTVLHQHKHGEISDDELLEWYVNRNERLDLDLESNCFLNYRYDLVSRIHSPESYKIILPVRSPKEWLKAILNNNMRFPAAKSVIVAKYHDVLFKTQSLSCSCNYLEGDALLEQWNLYPIDVYLRYWVEANESVMKYTEQNRLLVLRTEDISNHNVIRLLAEFSGWTKENATSSSTSGGESVEALECHFNAAPKDYKIMEQMNQDFVNQRIEMICGPTMEKLWKLMC